MTRYLIIRHGSNGANQSMREVAPVAIVEAKSREEATRTESDGHCSWLALDERVTVYANQWLNAVPASRARIADMREADEADARESLEQWRVRTAAELRRYEADAKRARAEESAFWDSEMRALDEREADRSRNGAY